MNTFCPTCSEPIAKPAPDSRRVGTVAFCTQRCLAGWYQDPLHDRRHRVAAVAVNRRGQPRVRGW
jgi:hypothetical protein